MINQFQTLIRTGPLAKELGISVPTLCRWTSDQNENGARLRACMLRRGWYSVPKLRAAGLLPERVNTQPKTEGVCDVG